MENVRCEKKSLSLRGCVNIINPQFQLWGKEAKTKFLGTVLTVFRNFHTVSLREGKGEGNAH